MAAITPSARTTETDSTQIDDLTESTNYVEMGVLLVLFVALVGFAITHLDTAFAGFAALGRH